ncbi:MAG: glycosyltransferase family 39 protein [Chloroflexi bacterium]|nr:glycosyltransferase family 39 protein [Chloroflexota bacterium]
MSRISGRTWLVIVALLLAAATVRIHNIDAQNIWADEGFTYFATQAPDLVGLLRSDVHPPLYFGAMRLWTGFAGTSEMALRLPSALAALVSVALVFRLALDLVETRGRRAGPVFAALAALVMVLSDLEVDLSQEARMYTVQSALSVAAVIAYVRWLKHGRRSMLIVLLLSSAALVYVNYLGAWVPITIGLHAVLTMRPRRAFPVVAALAAAAAAVVPWLFTVGVQQIGNGAGADRADPATWDTLLRYRDIWFGQMWPLTLGLLGVGAATLFRLLARTQDRRIGVLLVLWIALPLALTWIATNFVPVLAAHRISHVTPAIALLIALGLMQFPVGARTFMVAAIVVSGATSVDFYRVKGPWEQYVGTVASFVRTDELVLMEIGGGDSMLEYYFDRVLPDGTDLRSLKRWREGQPTTFAEELPQVIESYDTVWLLHWSSETHVFDVLREAGFVQTMQRTTQHIQDSRLDSYRFDRVQESDVGRIGPLVLRRARLLQNRGRIDLWWSVQSPVTEMLVTSAFLLDADGTLVAQMDSPPMMGERPASSMLPGDVVYDPKVLTTPDGAPLPSGTYRAGVVVYRFVDGGTERLLRPEGGDTLDLGEFTID